MHSMTTVPDDIRTLACKQAAERMDAYTKDFYALCGKGDTVYACMHLRLYCLKQSDREQAFAIGLASN